MIQFSKIAVVLSSVAIFVVSTLQPHSISDENPNQNKKQQDDDKFTLPKIDRDSVARRDFMRTKLMYTQNIFEGLTVGNFDSIDKAIHEVKMITEGEQWVAIETDSYRQLTNEFKTATRRLEQAAESKNIEATALRFYELSTSCIDCHQHIRTLKYDL